MNKEFSFRCDKIGKVYHSEAGLVTALNDVCFWAGKKEFISIVGPSGCGKTTLLKIIAGLQTPTRGTVHFFDHVENNGALQCALVFQQHGLFPWMNLIDNVAFGLEMMKVPKRERTERAIRFIRKIGLGDMARAWPHELSVGMRQRVGIARAFVSNPEILLLDEPFASLDAQTRIVLQEELLKTWREDPKVVVLVTHDIDEAILLGDRVLIMSGSPGKITENIAISIPRSRDPSVMRRPDFLDLKDHIWKKLKKEVKKNLALT